LEFTVCSERTAMGQEASTPVGGWKGASVANVLATMKEQPADATVQAQGCEALTYVALPPLPLCHSPSLSRTRPLLSHSSSLTLPLSLSHFLIFSPPPIVRTPSPHPPMQVPAGNNRSQCRGSQHVECGCNCSKGRRGDCGSSNAEAPSEPTRADVGLLYA
jgi:hypothetical protein